MKKEGSKPSMRSLAHPNTIGCPSAQLSSGNALRRDFQECQVIVQRHEQSANEAKLNSGRTNEERLNQGEGI